MSEYQYEFPGDPVRILHPEESWEFLRTHEFGRLAFHLIGEVHIVPINYAVDNHRLIFLTTEGSKVFGVTMNDDVAFEADEITGEHATSVVVRGSAHLLDGEDAYVAERLPLRPWVGTPKYTVIGVTVEEISGRRFDLSRPWMRARVDVTHG